VVTTPSSLVNCLVAIQRSGAKFVSALFMVGDLADMLPSFLRMVRSLAPQPVELGRRMHRGLEPVAGARHPQPALLRLSVSAISDPTHFSVGAGCGAGNDNREGRKFCAQRGQLIKLACPYCGAPKLIALEECKTLRLTAGPGDQSQISAAVLDHVAGFILDFHYLSELSV
jgi:hypothetical protein